MYHLTNIDSLIMIHYACFHSLLTYGIIFRGSSTDVKGVPSLQKKAVRIMMGVNSRSSCRPVLKKLKILTVPAQYISSLMTFFVQNSEYFIFNHSVHSIETRGRLQLHRPGEKPCIILEGCILCNCEDLQFPKCVARLVNDKKKLCNN
jgi:hypothetical protein